MDFPQNFFVVLWMSSQSTSQEKRQCSGSSENNSPELRDLRDLSSFGETLENVEKELTEYKDITSKDIDYYLDLLHQYNEVKDTAQELIGHMARLRGTSTKQIYTEMFPEVDDVGDLDT